MKTKSLLFSRFLLPTLFGFFVLSIFAFSPKAEAKILNLYLDAYPGMVASGVIGLPEGSNYQGEELYRSQHTAYNMGFHVGGRAGLDVLIFTTQLRFDQYLNLNEGGKFSGTLGQLVGGFHFRPINNSGVVLHLNILGGIVFGLGLSPQIPINVDQISKFGFTGEAEAVLELPITKQVFSFFASAVIGYHVTGFDSVRMPNMDDFRNKPHGPHFFLRAGFRFNLLGF